MAQDVVGFRFHPTGEELITFYLKNKILNKPWLVQDAINEINICNYDPDILPYLSKLQPKDPEWFFFSPIEYTTSKKSAIKRTTPSGFWKATGNDRKIKDKRGHGVEIGIKKTLVYRLGRVPNDVSTHWVIHEYHITRLPLLKDLSQSSYVICQVMYKGEDADKFLVNNSNGPSQSLVSDPNFGRAVNTGPYVSHVVDGLSLDDLPIPMPDIGEVSPGGGFNPDTLLRELDNRNNLNLQPQTPYDDEYFSGLVNYYDGNFEEAFPLPEIMMYTNLNKHGPKQPVSGYIDESGSDGNDETLSGMSYQGPSSPCDSSGSSRRYFPSSSSTDSCKDVQTSANLTTNRKNRETQLTRRTNPSAEKKGWFITEEAMERNGKNLRYIYLMNMVTGFILLLALISNIIYSVLARIKT